MEHRFRLVCFEQLKNEVMVREVALDETQVVDRFEPFAWLFDPRRRDAAGLCDPLASCEVVDTDDAFVETVSQSQCCRPTEVAIGTCQ